MTILNRPISEKTASIASSIEQSLQLPIVYEASKTDAQHPYAGRVNPFGENGRYTVWLNSTLPQKPFEADLLHELFHIVQIQNGFPSVHNKGNRDFYSHDQAIIQEIGSHLASSILDLGVNQWLETIGYDYSFFTSHNYTFLLEDADTNYINWRDSLNYANIALALFHATLYVDDVHAKALFSKYEDRYAPIVEDSSKLRSFVLSLGNLTPEKATLAQCTLIDRFHLWSHYFVVSPALDIRTQKEFLSWQASSNYD